MSRIMYFNHLEEFLNSWKYSGQLKEEWLKLIKGKPVNARRVPRNIFESWQRCKESGIDPYEPLQFIDIKTEAKDIFEIMKKYERAFRVIGEIGKAYGFEIQCYDKKGKCANIDKHWLTDIGKLPNINQSGLFNEIIEKKSIIIDVMESNIGSNAVGFALNENKPAIMLGAWHYAYYLQQINCSAAPIHDLNGEILGALNIITRDKKSTLDGFVLINSLAQLFDSFIVGLEEESRKVIEDNELRTILSKIPQGVILTDSCNVIKYHNDRVIDILEMSRESGVKDKLIKFLPQLISQKGIGKKSRLLTVHGIPKSVKVSVTEITDMRNESKSKLIFLEEENSWGQTHKPKDNQTQYTFDDIIGKNIKILEAKSMAATIAPTKFPILIMGESGTGKELFAQAIHNASTRRDNKFVAINCGAIPAELVESELFGYEPGSFTGASKIGKQGQIEAASGGTLFLDEIESMPQNIQIKLLRTLSTQKILKVGGTSEISVDVRIISATKKDLLVEADGGRFREDLYYRLNNFIVELPALRERTDDIPVLAKYYIDSYCQEIGRGQIIIQDKFLEALKDYYWRGNVRELKNVIESILVFAGDQEELTIRNIPEKIRNPYDKTIKAYLYDNISCWKSEKDLLSQGEEIIIKIVLEETGGNINKAANRLGISRQTLYKKIKDSTGCKTSKYLTLSKM